jgi:hypothetical protein
MGVGAVPSIRDGRPPVINPGIYISFTPPALKIDFFNKKKLENRSYN